MSAIEVADVTKEFGDVTALSGLDLTVSEGEIFGFLGPNGAGKTTTIDILLDIVRPSAGTATVLGHDTREEAKTIRGKTGYVPETVSIYERLTGRRHLLFVIETRAVDDDPDALLDRVGLSGAGDREAGEYSKGMKYRLSLAMALVGDPDLLILDEPSTWLDPNGARRMREITREVNDRGTTVFFSSHILGQVEAVCDTVGILRDGQLIAKDDIEGLRAAAEADAQLHLTLASPEAAREAQSLVRSIDTVSNVTRTDETVTLTCPEDEQMAVMSELEGADVSVETFETDALRCHRRSFWNPGRLATSSATG